MWVYMIDSFRELAIFEALSSMEEHIVNWVTVCVKKIDHTFPESANQGKSSRSRESRSENEHSLHLVFII